MLWRNRTTSISSNKFLLEQYRKYFTTILHLMLFIHVIKSETIYLKFCNKYFCRFIDPVLFFELKLYDLMLTIVVKWVIDDKKKIIQLMESFSKKGRRSVCSKLNFRKISPNSFFKKIEWIFQMTLLNLRGLFLSRIEQNTNIFFWTFTCFLSKKYW